MATHALPKTHFFLEGKICAVKSNTAFVKIIGSLYFKISVIMIRMTVVIHPLTAIPG